MGPFLSETRLRCEAHSDKSQRKDLICSNHMAGLSSGVVWGRFRLEVWEGRER